MHCYTAAVVLLIDRWYVGTGKPGSIQADDSQERKRKITTAADLLRFATRVALIRQPPTNAFL